MVRDKYLLCFAENNRMECSSTRAGTISQPKGVT